MWAMSLPRKAQYTLFLFTPHHSEISPHTMMFTVEPLISISGPNCVTCWPLAASAWTEFLPNETFIAAKVKRTPCRYALFVSFKRQLLWGVRRWQGHAKTKSPSARALKGLVASKKIAFFCFWEGCQTCARQPKTPKNQMKTVLAVGLEPTLS